jgi:hypothetical protein
LPVVAGGAADLIHLGEVDADRAIVACEDLVG